MIGYSFCIRAMQRMHYTKYRTTNKEKKIFRKRDVEPQDKRKIEKKNVKSAVEKNETKVKKIKRTVIIISKCSVCLSFLFLVFRICVRFIFFPSFECLLQFTLHFLLCNCCCAKNQERSLPFAKPFIMHDDDE